MKGNDNIKRFKAFLISKSAYAGFCEGLRERRGVTFVQRMNETTYFIDLINSSLAWEDTSEGRPFWAALNKEWKKVFNNPDYTPGCNSIW